MENTNTITHELMKVRGRKALLEKEIEVLTEQETFLTGFIEETPALKKGKSKAAPVSEEDTDDDERTVATTSTKKRGTKPAPAKLEASSDDEEAEEVSELDEALGADEEEEEVKTASEDDIRGVLTKIVKKKGEAGKKRAREILSKLTKNNSGLVKDIKSGKHQDVYEALTTLL